MRYAELCEFGGEARERVVGISVVWAGGEGFVGVGTDEAVAGGGLGCCC